VTQLPTPTLEQQTALDTILDWYENRTCPALAVGGYAGTGKTTLVAHLLSRLHDGGALVAVATLSGKAASVLRAKGIDDACTLHSIFYQAFPVKGGKVAFTRRSKDDESIQALDLLVVDEASMIDTKLRDDILSFEKPVLWVGDHGQLPPIGDDPGIMHPANLGAKLETIHRQALDSPIIRYAHHVRENGVLPPTEEAPGFRYCAAKSIPWASWSSLPQIIVSTNMARHFYNRNIRTARGFTSPTPVPGDRIICLRNNYEVGIFNGELFTVTDSTHEGLELTADDGRLLSGVNAWQHGWYYTPGQEPVFPWGKHADPTLCLFDYGYSITCHKAQGSSWPHTLIVETPCRAWTRNRWAYTAITRAEKTCTYVQP